MSEIVYSEIAVKCECGHIATFKNVNDGLASIECRGCDRLVSVHATITGATR